MFFIPKPYKLISGLLTSKLIEEALDSFLSSRLSDFQSVLIPELQSEMLALALITSSLFSSQTHLITFITFLANEGIIFVCSENHIFFD